MKILISALIGLIFTSFILTEKGRIQKNNISKEEPWVQFIDTIGTFFIIKLEYPKSYVAEQIQNGIFVGKLIDNPQNDITNTSDWCIGIESGDIYSVESIVNTEKSLVDSGINITTDTINFMGKSAIHLSYDTNLIGNKVYRREIIVQEHAPIVLVVKKDSDIEGFERFVESIQLLKYPSFSDSKSNKCD
ncbi:hypothetical protein EYV94_27715 [Puteibacter caeruleilacunae]|nr:hypothetical protein EYV94_27715 [Puteibacter caeruleilacunae]